MQDENQDPGIGDLSTMDDGRWTMDDIRLVPMAPAHLPAVVEIEERCFRTPWGRDAFLRELSRTDICYYIVAVDDAGRAVGFAGMWGVAGEAHVTTLAVDPKVRRRGIGERLLVDILEEALRRGAGHVTLEYRVSNLGARRLYEKYGFVAKAIRRGYYRDDGEDAMVMAIDDLADPAWRDLFARRRAELGRREV